MKLTILTSIVALLVLIAIFELVRRRQLREKYALLWLAVGIVTVVLGLFPRLLDRIAHTVGVASGASLVLFLGIVFVLLVCVHLSWEVNRLEEETRSLAEDLALTRTEVARMRAEVAETQLTISGLPSHLGRETVAVGVPQQRKASNDQR